MTTLTRATILAILAASPLAAQTFDPFQIAVGSGVCGTAGVASATFDPATNKVSAVCNDAAVPAAGDLAADLATRADVQFAATAAEAASE
jgi:hypothetical protein